MDFPPELFQLVDTRVSDTESLVSFAHSLVSHPTLWPRFDRARASALRLAASPEALGQAVDSMMGILTDYVAQRASSMSELSDLASFADEIFDAGNMFDRVVLALDIVPSICPSIHEALLFSFWGIDDGIAPPPPAAAAAASTAASTAVTAILSSTLTSELPCVRLLPIILDPSVPALASVFTNALAAEVTAAAGQGLTGVFLALEIAAKTVQIPILHKLLHKIAGESAANGVLDVVGVPGDSLLQTRITAFCNGEKDIGLLSEVIRLIADGVGGLQQVEVVAAAAGAAAAAAALGPVMQGAASAPATPNPANIAAALAPAYYSVRLSTALAPAATTPAAAAAVAAVAAAVGRGAHAATVDRLTGASRLIAMALITAANTGQISVPAGAGAGVQSLAVEEDSDEAGAVAVISGREVLFTALELALQESHTHAAVDCACLHALSRRVIGEVTGRCNPSVLLRAISHQPSSAWERILTVLDQPVHATTLSVAAKQRSPAAHEVTKVVGAGAYLDTNFEVTATLLRGRRMLPLALVSQPTETVPLDSISRWLQSDGTKDEVFPPAAAAAPAVARALDHIRGQFVASTPHAIVEFCDDLSRVVADVQLPAWPAPQEVVCTGTQAGIVLEVVRGEDSLKNIGEKLSIPVENVVNAASLLASVGLLTLDGDSVLIGNTGRPTSTIIVPQYVNVAPAAAAAPVAAAARSYSSANSRAIIVRTVKRSGRVLHDDLVNIVGKALEEISMSFTNEKIDKDIKYLVDKYEIDEDNEALVWPE